MFKCVQARANLNCYNLQYNVCWKRELLIINGLGPKVQPLKPEHLDALLLLPIENSKDCDGEIKLLENDV